MMHSRRWGALAASLALTACATAPPSARQPDNSNAYANFLIGRVANLRQDYQAASDRYFEALVRSPHDETLLEGAITSALANGDVVRARQIARMAPRNGGPNYVHVVRAADALNAGRWRVAREELDHVEGGAAEQLLSRVLLTWARAGEGRTDDAVVQLDRVSSLRPYGGLFAYQQAMALDYGNRSADALTAYTAAADGGLFMPSALERHADLLVRTGARDQAIALLSVDPRPNNPGLAAALARVQAGQPSAASERLTPSNGAAIGLYGLAVILFQENETTNALSCLTLALMLHPQMDPARLAFAEAQNGLDHRESAMRMLEQVAPTSPYAETARVAEAWTLVDADRADEAVSLLRVAAESGTARSKRALADVYRRLKRYGEAETIYTDLIAQSSNDWRLFFARGATRERLDRWPEAEADLQRAMQISPDQPDVLNYLGYTWIDRGERIQEGMALVQRAADLRPLSGGIIDSLGWGHFKLGEYTQAVDLLERAVELEPADAILNDHLGDAYWRAEQRVQARFQWQRTLTLNPDDPAAIQQKIDHGLPPLPRPRSAGRR